MISLDRKGIQDLVFFTDDLLFLLRFLMMAGVGDDYSTLEALHLETESLQTQKDTPTHVDSGKEVVQSYGHYAPELISPGSGIELVPKSDYQQDQPLYAQSKNFRRKWLILGGILVLIVIVLGAVLGGVLGSRSKSISGEVSVTPSSTPTRSSSPQSPQFQSNIAAISLVYKNANRTRLYYQSSTGQLMQAAESTNGKWENTPLGSNFLARTGTPLAAAITKKSPYVCSLYSLPCSMY